jgi:2-dehydro-3-deoxyphosphogluconate aldolase / (4S)-4-hydroxy-2-oxoglutarate aldolase
MSSIASAPVAPNSTHVGTGLEQLLQFGKLVPVITIERVEDAVPLARALVAGGLRLLEITLRTMAAVDAARKIIAEVPDAIVGIGTVLTPEDLQCAIDLGAKFALSPGATPGLLEAAAAGPIPFIPGVATSSELMQGIGYGFNTFKFFPAVPSGGIPALKALSGPFPRIKFCPTGGIGADNAAEWLALPNVVALGGSWLTSANDVRSGNWAAITARAQHALTRIGTSA